MRIQIASDLHLEHNRWMPEIAEGVDVAILAGDLASYDEDRVWQVANEWEEAGKILYVPGNHEYYGHEVGGITDRMRSDCEAEGVVLLDRETVVIEGVKFLGATLWTDFGYFGEARRWAACQTAAREMNDFRLIYTTTGLLTPQETMQWHRRDREWIERVLGEEHAGPVVVVTHHAPTPASVQPRYRGDLLTAAFASDLDPVIARHQPELWIHGHMHDNVDVELGATRVICNPRGYGAENADGFIEQLVIEL